MISGDSDPVPPELLAHIIARTTSFCKDSGRTGVKRVTILHKLKEQSTKVMYLCYGEVDGVVEDGERPALFMAREEFNGRLVRYQTPLALILGF